MSWVTWNVSLYVLCAVYGSRFLQKYGNFPSKAGLVFFDVITNVRTYIETLLGRQLSLDRNL